MCGILGISGKFNREMFEESLMSIRHRGDDFSDVFIDEENSIALGHNLLSIFSQANENNLIIDNIEENRQPIMMDDLVLIFNGEIYNFNRLEDFLNKNNEEHIESKSDSQLLAKLIAFQYGYNANGNLLESVKSVIPCLDGDYSFAVYDKKNNDIAIARDPIGVKPLYYGIDEEKEISAFASEKKALWKLGISDEKIKTLRPGAILYNWELIDSDETLISRIIATDFKAIKDNYMDYNDYLETKDSYDVYMELLSDDLFSAVEKRVENISDVGLIFSGGVDSTILAVLLKRIAEKRRENKEAQLNMMLYSVGVESSQDIKYSRMIADELDLPLKTVIIDEETVNESMEPVLTAIEDDNIMKLGVGMTIYLASKAMKEDNIKVALSGQGADELFGGYNRYLKHFDEKNLYDAYFALDEEIYHDIANMYHVNLERDDAVSMANGVELRVPFLDGEIIDLALDIPGKYKIKSQDDILRKHILRDAAKSIGVPDCIAERPKKAAQYGTGINKILKKKVLRSFDIREFVESLKNN